MAVALQIVYRKQAWEPKAYDKKMKTYRNCGFQKVTVKGFSRNESSEQLEDLDRKEKMKDVVHWELALIISFQFENQDRILIRK